MTDLAADISAPLSTVIDTEPGPSASGGGAPPLAVEPKAEEPKSLRDDIEAVFKEEAKPEKVEKAEPAKDEAKAKAEKVEEKQPAAAVEKEPVEPAPKADTEPKGDEKQDASYREPPKRFLADSREVWRNVPRAVRRDIEAMEADYRQHEERTREVSDRYDRIREFDEIARSNGRELRESLAQVNQFENLMRQNPVAALNMALQQVGPRKPDGQPFSLIEVAQHIVQQGPEGYQRMVAQPQPQPQEDPRVAQLQQQLQQVQLDQLANTVIEPFKATHPRYDELADDIALFLQSGKIPQTLSHHERLAAAYDMAERVNPSSRAYQSAPAFDDSPAPDRRADPDFSGSKSIKSSPGSVTEEVEDEGSRGESIRDSIQKASRGLRRN